MLQNFRERVDEVEVYLSFVSEIDAIETYKQQRFILDADKQLTIKRDLQKVLRANCFLVLYNLVEATVRDSLWSLFDIVSDEQLTYKDLSDNLKEIWLKQQSTEMSLLTNQVKIKERIGQLITLQNDATITFSKNRISLSGNLDYRFIEKLIAEYGFHGSVNVDKKRVAKALLKVKSERNYLAHGNKSFRQVAEVVTIQEITNCKILIVEYLTDYVNNVLKYFEDEKYKLSQSIT